MKAQRLPSGNYRVRVTDPITKKRISFTASTKKEAEYEATLFLNGQGYAPSGQTVGEAIDEYIDMKEHILSPTTIHGYRRNKINNLAELCAIPLAKLTPQAIQRHMNKLAACKSAKTVRLAHGLLASVLAVFAPDFKLRTSLPTIQKKLREIPSAEDLLPVIIGTEIELPCLLAMWSGMRMSEIRGLTKSDLHDNIILINHTVVTVEGQHIKKKETKTFESARPVRLDSYILNLIEKLPEEQEELTTLSGQAIYKRFSRLLMNAGIPHITFHDLRHVNASTMSMLNIPEKYAMERNGWSNPHIMRDVYTHTFTEERNAVDDKIDGYFNSILDSVHKRTGEVKDTKLDTKNSK